MLQLLEHFEATFTRHRNVEHNDVPVLLLEQTKDLLPVPGLADSECLKLVAQYLYQPAPDDCMVICDKNFHRLFTWDAYRNGSSLSLHTGNIELVRHIIDDENCASGFPFDNESSILELGTIEFETHVR